MSHSASTLLENLKNNAPRNLKAFEILDRMRDQIDCEQQDQGRKYTEQEMQQAILGEVDTLPSETKEWLAELP